MKKFLIFALISIVIGVATLATWNYLKTGTMIPSWAGGGETPDADAITPPNGGGDGSTPGSTPSPTPEPTGNGEDPAASAFMPPGNNQGINKPKVTA